MTRAAARILDFPQDFIPESDLVTSDGIPLDDPRQRKQINLTLDLVARLMAERGESDYYAGGNEFVYYSTEQARAIARSVQLPLPGVADAQGEEPPEEKPFKGPDVFVVRGGVAPRKRSVWASWLENGRLPDFVFEIQSPSTAHVDAGAKRRFYAQEFKSREYFCYGPDDPKLRTYRDTLVGLRLGRRGVYEALRSDERGWVWSEVLDVFFGRWDGVYDGTRERWIRLYDAQGRMIPTGQEAAEQRAQTAEQRAQAAEQRAQAERQKRETAEQRAAEAEAEILRLRKLMESGES